jgi:hypothetical protein
MAEVVCKGPECTKTDLRGGAKGLCSGHYQQMRAGNPLTPIVHDKELGPLWIARHVNHVGDECLTWPFFRDERGRAQVNVNRRTMGAAKYMCRLAHGEPPTPKHQAAHSCGKAHEGCINPNHLSWKTAKENAADKITHGTAQRGSKHGNAVLNEDLVRYIRRIAYRIPRKRVFAEALGITYGTLWEIITRRSWRHVE